MVREYRLSEPPSWPLRGLAAAILGMALTTWFVLPTTLRGDPAPLVPALVLEAFFLGGVATALRTSPGELQDGIVAVVAAGAVIVGVYTLNHWLVGGDLSHPASRVLLSLTVGVAAGLITTIPAFGVHLFNSTPDEPGLPE